MWFICWTGQRGGVGVVALAVGCLFFTASLVAAAVPIHCAREIVFAWAQVARVCKTHALHSALIHIFNRGLDDFISPIEELMPISDLLRKDHPANPETRVLKLLVYLQECFRGHWFPPGRGDLPAHRVPMLRAHLLAFLLQPLNPPGGTPPLAACFVRTPAVFKSLLWRQACVSTIRAPCLTNFWMPVVFN